MQKNRQLTDTNANDDENSHITTNSNNNTLEYSSSNTYIDKETSGGQNSDSTSDNSPEERDISQKVFDNQPRSSSSLLTLDTQAQSNFDFMTLNNKTKQVFDRSLIDKVLNCFKLNNESLKSIKSNIKSELELGLRDEDQATIKMLITYVRELSRGDECGSYLALDLGGTHFRVLLVDLNEGASEPKVTSVTHDIPKELLVTKNGQELFDYIALKLLDFVTLHKLKRRRISLGFTFSFPCKQYGLTQSILVKWCKGFNVGGIVGTDVVKQLKDALKRQLAGRCEAYIDVVAVINDTTGTLVACANKYRECRIGLIVGTGFNACYMEQLEKCEKWPANYTTPKQVIINCEWGAMGDNKDRRELDQFRNEFDNRIDSESVNPQNQTYEKMIAGMYVGELLRLSLLKLFNLKLIFNDGSDINDTGAGSSQTGGCKNSTGSLNRAASSTRPPNGASSPPPPPPSPRSRSPQVSINGSISSRFGAISSFKLPTSAAKQVSGSTNLPLTQKRVAGGPKQLSPSSPTESMATQSAQSTRSLRSRANKSAVSPSWESSDHGQQFSNSKPTGGSSNVAISDAGRMQLAKTTATLVASNPSAQQPQASISKDPSIVSGVYHKSGSNRGHKLNEKDILDGRHLSMLAKDELAGSYEETIKILAELNIQYFTQDDLVVVIKLGSAIINRSANLVACGISALLERCGREKTIIGYDGSMIRHHPYFLKRLIEKTAQLTGKEHKFEFIQSSDGSGIGAAVVAAALHKERRPLYVVKNGKLYELHFTKNPSQLSSSCIKE